jgi:hypothetical protein
MQEPTIEDVDVLFGAATPHFAYQIRERIQRLVASLPSDHPVKAYATVRLAQLDALGQTTSKAESGDPSAPHRV